jgi:hypothetical protein
MRLLQSLNRAASGQITAELALEDDDDDDDDNRL